MVTIDQVDRRIVDALNVNPRASWTLVGSVLNMDPVTAARRWNRLRSTGQAWVAAYPGSSAAGSLAGAFVEVICEPGAGGRVADLLAEDPRVLNVMQTAGGRDVLVTVATTGRGELTRYLDSAFDGTPGIRSTRSAIITRIMQEGSRWRGGSLSATQQDALRSTVPTTDIELPLESIDYRLLTVLAEDGRMSIDDLAKRCESSVSTVRRRLPQLLSSGAIRLRPDLARGLSDYPFVAEYFIQTPSQTLDEVYHHICQLPAVRTCFAVMGAFNIIVGAWMKTQQEVHDFEVSLAHETLPIRIVDRSPVLRFAKHVGRILDDDGNAVRYVPMQYRLPMPS